MRVHVLERQQWLEASRDGVFRFFAQAENLERITPPWLHFRIQTPQPIEMQVGTRIDYRIRLAGLPLRWRTHITAWEPGSRFVDTQERGPYRLWEHLHEFEVRGNGVLMTDRVRYALPFAPLDRIAHGVAVRAALAAIFDYRFRRVREIFAADSTRSSAPVRSGRPARAGVA
jgi:ligand-binding SRPBCC domain-containing protein